MTKVGIIGAGIMGQYMAKALAPQAGIRIYARDHRRPELAKNLAGIDYKIAESYEATVQDADAVIFCVPTHMIQDVMRQTLPSCKKGAIISGQTSRKTPEGEVFDRYMRSKPSAGLHLVTIHTMCNPSASDASEEILAIIRHNPSSAPDYRHAYSRAMQFYGPLSRNVQEFESIDEHDSMTANTQINTSRTFLSIASAFAKVGCFPEHDETYSSALDRMKFSLAMRAASLPSHVYRGIQFGSRHGKDIVSKAIQVETELYGMIVGEDFDAYRKRVMSAKDVLFQKFRAPVLDDGVMKNFGDIESERPNSHFSMIQWAVAAAESGRDPFNDLKATTPLYTSLLCMMDRLFRSDALSRAISAPFENSRLRADDLVFHDENKGWSDAMLSGNTASYDSRHERMTDTLDEQLIQEEVDNSKEVIRTCREAAAKF